MKHLVFAGTLALAVLALAACDRSPNTPHPVTDTPTSGMPASTPATSGAGPGGLPSATAPSTGSDTLGGAGGTTATPAGSGTTGVPPSASPSPVNPSAAASDGRDAGGTMSGGTGQASDASGRAGAPAQAATALAREDQDFLAATAASGLFELAMAQMALQRAGHPEVRRFAQLLATHHAGANQELQALAQSKGVTLPTDAPADKTALLARLGNSRGADFDRQFVQTVGVRAHREDIALFERGAREARDPQVRAFAQRMLPLLQQHLDAARQLPGAAEEARRDAGRGGNPPR